MTLGLGTGFYKLSRHSPYNWDPIKVNGGDGGVSMEVWFRTDVGVTVSQWDDSSGNNNDISQSASGDRPAIVNTLAGDGLDFVASESDHMDFDSAVEITAETGFTIFVVCELDDISSNRALLGLTGGTAHFMEFKAGGDNIRIKLGSTLTDIAPTEENQWEAGAKFLCTLIREDGSTGNLTLHKNGTKLAQDSQATNTGDGEFNSFAARNNDRPFEGKIHEFIFYNGGDITGVELNRMHTYLKNKHGL